MELGWLWTCLVRGIIEYIQVNKINKYIFIFYTNRTFLLFIIRKPCFLIKYDDISNVVLNKKLKMCSDLILKNKNNKRNVLNNVKI